MNAKQLFNYIWREVHRGNLLVIAGLIFTYFWLIHPIMQHLTAQDETTAYIMQDLDTLKKELKSIKQDTRIELGERKSGKLGTTRH